jgi:hypothetical protein
VDPLRPTGQDVVGIVFRVPLVDGGDQLAYMLHRGDTKNPDPTSSWCPRTTVTRCGGCRGADPEKPQMAPIRR